MTKFQFVSAIDAGEAFKRDILVAVLVANTTSMDFEVLSPKRISNSNYSETAYTPFILVIMCAKNVGGKVVCGFFIVDKTDAENMKKIVGAI